MKGKQRTRLLVLTDISSDRGGFKEPDDTQSLVRLLTYANEFKIEGLIATYTSHWNDAKPEYLEYIVKKYGKVRDNLIIHDPCYPAEEELMNCIRTGNPRCGIEQIGPGKDTEGSEWIISVVDKPEPQPVWITIWGGPLDLAQALWKVRSTRTEEEVSKFISKISVYAIHDQYDTTGPWIRENFKDLFYIINQGSMRGVYKDGEQFLVSPEWLLENVCKGHGEFGEAYPIYDGGDPWGKVKGMKEGDTPSFLYLIPNGLGDPEKPHWSSWGGVFRNIEGTNHYTDVIPEPAKPYSERENVYKWREDYQADFAARMDWCVKTFEECSHSPVIVLKNQQILEVKPGEKIELDASESYDVNGRKLSFSWGSCMDAETCKEEPCIEGRNSSRAIVCVPLVDRTEEICILLTVVNDGEPKLKSYRRVVIRVVP